MNMSQSIVSKIEKGPLDKRSARGDMKDMRQNSTISATSTAGGVTGAGDLQSDTWSVDAYASEEGSEPPPEPTSVERLSVSCSSSHFIEKKTTVQHCLIHANCMY